MPDITIKVPDGEFSGYLAKPASGKGPGILVIQEIFGVNKDMRDHCDNFAAQGYVALCPDIFWRQEPGVQITDQSEEEWQHAFKLYQGFDVDKGVEDLKASLAHLRKVEGCTGKVGRSEEHTSELQSLMRISYAVFCLKKKKKKQSH